MPSKAATPPASFPATPPPPVWGGIGKTQLAAAFAHHYGQYFLGGVYWLSFADPAAISAEVAQCAAWMSDLPPGVTHLPLPDQLQMVRRS